MTTPMTKERLEEIRECCIGATWWHDDMIEEMVDEIDRLTAELAAANKRIAELSKDREELMQYLPGD